jgi:predicted CxxxxCH...CXXCH cytochrome family protein
MTDGTLGHEERRARARPRRSQHWVSAATRSRVGRLVAVVVAVAACAACGSPADRSAPGASSAKGVPGVSFSVRVQRGAGGTVTSHDGRIVCGTGGAACTADYAWTAQVVLTATPDPGNMFATWVGDCQYTGPCVLDTRRFGADKFAGAVFGPAGETLHGNFSSPAVHGVAFLDRLAGLPDAFDCSSSRCHGPGYDGRGIAPSCNACHAAAGWGAWLTNCTFCHGTRVQSGYAFAADPVKAAPPDAIAERLSGAPVPARSGSHLQHLTGRTGAGAVLSAPFRCATCHPVPADLSHVGGSTARATVTLSGAGQGSLPASLGTYDPGTGTCVTYCHGNGRAAGSSPPFAGAIPCGGCHAAPPASGHPPTDGDPASCRACHPETMDAAGAILASGGKHVDGAIQAAACDGCHGFPPASGAHAAHYGLPGPAPIAHRDARTLEDSFPGATPTTAPAVYAFGCGSCHPLDLAAHANGVADVVLYEEAAPEGSLKRLAAPAAAYDRAAGTCSGVYCHSSGQAAPVHRATPGWRSGTKLSCAGCHDNPPRYASGGPGAGDANSHVGLADDGYEFGHFLGLLGPWHTSKHGGNWSPAEDAAAITCQTCHADTVDPSNTGPSGFYYLDTSGDYVLPGGSPRRSPAWFAGLRCTTCHTEGSAVAPRQGGRVLPLRHVNGRRDVVFDAREALPPVPWLPASPGTPVKPYWFTGGAPSMFDWTGVPVTWSARTASFSLTGASYDPATKTCSSVACHMVESPQWGRPYQYGGFSTCYRCHPNL